MTITTRTGKGSELTWAEVDTNWTDLVSAIATKQTTLVSGTSIKTINGSSILGSGDVVISSGLNPFLLMGA